MTTFETRVLETDSRILSYTILENGNYLITIKPEYVNPELNINSFETGPAIAEFDTKISSLTIS